jgi:DNA repair protein RecO (recombination protein O)
MERFIDEALVLGSVDYGEADRIVTLLTRDHGRLSAFAAGARKSKRRFAGALEPATHLKASLVSRRGDTFRLDAADVVRSFHRFSQELPLIARALYCLELCRELTRDQQPHEALFDGLKDYLGQLDEHRAGPTSLLKFELDALKHTGFMPRFDDCALCGRLLVGAPRFDPHAGGAVCEACGPAGRPMERRLVEGLSGLQAGSRTPLSRELRAQARDVLNLFITHQLGRRLKSVDFLEQVGD